MKVTLTFDTANALISAARMSGDQTLKELGDKASIEMKAEDPVAEEVKRKSRARNSHYGSTGINKPTFIELWNEGLINPSTPVLRERLRKNGKYYANDAALESHLKKSPTIYKQHEDGTWSLVRPPRPTAVA